MDLNHMTIYSKSISQIAHNYYQMWIMYYRNNIKINSHHTETLTCNVKLGKDFSYSTVTDFAKLRGWSTSVPLITATW